MFIVLSSFIGKFLNILKKDTKMANPSSYELKLAFCIAVRTFLLQHPRLAESAGHYFPVANDVKLIGEIAGTFQNFHPCVLAYSDQESKKFPWTHIHGEVFITQSGYNMHPTFFVVTITSYSEPRKAYSVSFSHTICDLSVAEPQYYEAFGNSVMTADIEVATRAVAVMPHRTESLICAELLERVMARR